MNAARAVLVAVAVAATAAAAWVWWPDQVSLHVEWGDDTPDCPTEDSCTVDYRDGAWHITEIQP